MITDYNQATSNTKIYHLDVNKSIIKSEGLRLCNIPAFHALAFTRN